jgi:hypothetical protein
LLLFLYYYYHCVQYGDFIGLQFVLLSAYDNLGANPTIASYHFGVVNFYNAKGVLKTKIFYSTLKNAVAYYNAGVVKIYKAASSLVRLKNISFYFEKRSIPLQRWRCSCKFKCRRIGSSIRIRSRVIRSGKFAPIRWRNILGSFCENYRSSKNNLATFLNGKIYVLTITKNGLGYILFVRLFFTNASGHTDLNGGGM